MTVHGPPQLYFEPLKLLNFDFNADWIQLVPVPLMNRNLLFKINYQENIFYATLAYIRHFILAGFYDKNLLNYLFVLMGGPAFLWVFLAN